MSTASSQVKLSLPYKSGPDTRNRTMFPDPFLDMASLVMPESLKNVLDLCEGIWLKNGTYRMASSRVVRYFITQVQFEGADEDERQRLSTFIKNRFKVVDQLALLGDDYLCYGNSFSSIVLPFRRFLICKVCHQERPISRANWAFKEFEFSARCPRCGKWTPHGHIDRRSSEEDKICVKRWAPQELRLLCHPYTQDYEYYWDIPRAIRSEIVKGTRFYVEHMPWEIIEAVKQEQLFKFNPDVIYHMREDTLAGVNTRGWGVSRLLSNFAQAWYCQVLKRYNEALALDYVVPFRVLTPAAKRKEGDPMLNMNVGNFVSKVTRMLQQHRKDPAGWHALPFPLEYQALGGEAKSLTTPELLDQGMDELLNAVGIPAELYRGTLQLQAMPVALRLFENTWPQLVSSYNGWLDWATEIICTAMNWDKPEEVSLKPVTMADDIEQRAMWMQLASSNLISRRTAFAPWNLDAANEQKRVFEEQKLFDELQQEYAEDMQQRQINSQVMAGQGQQGAGVPTMGAGVAPGAANAGMTPMDMLAQADQLAQQLISMPYEARRRELMDIKKTNESLHALVKSKMEDLRSEAASVGQQAVLSGQV